MKSYLLATFVRALACASFGQVESQLTEEDMHLVHLMSLDLNERARQVQDLAPERRIRLYKYLRDNLNGPQWNYLQASDSQRILFALGEPQARKEVIEAFRKSPFDGGHALYWTGDPAVIEAIAPDLFQNEPAMPGGGDVIPVPVQDRAVVVILKTIIHSIAFDSDVVDWAKRNSWTATEGGLVALRQWWRENAELFAKKEYKFVKPGEDFLPEPEVVDNPSPAAPKRAVAVTAPFFDSSVPSSRTESSRSGISKWPVPVFAVASAVVVLLAGLLLLWKRRT